MVDPDAVTVARFGRHERWRIGGSAEVAWIASATCPGLTITAAIPPTFARYATVVIPDDDADKTRSDAAVLDVLSAHTPQQPWWLGYLDTGAPALVFPAAPNVCLYRVAVRAGRGRPGAGVQLAPEPGPDTLAQRASGAVISRRPVLAGVHLLGRRLALRRRLP